MKHICTHAMMAMALAGAAGTAPATCAASAGDDQSFDEWVKQIDRDYDSFVERINAHYADFLKGEWHPYEPLAGEVKNSVPKPETIGNAEGHDPSLGGRSKPALVAEAPEVRVTNSMMSVDKALDHAAKYGYGPTAVNDFMMRRSLRVEAPKAPEAPKEEAPADDSDHALHLFGRDNVDTFNYYGLLLDMPHIDFSLDPALPETEDFARQWERLAEEGVMPRLCEAFGRLRSRMNLNDYLTYTMVQAYMDDRFASADVTSRVAAAHQVMVNMGYDMRVAVTTEAEPLLLLPSRSRLYNYSSMEIDGRRFYVMPHGGVTEPVRKPRTFYTCRLPHEALEGKDFDMTLQSLDLPEKPVPFYLANGVLTLQGEVNENIFPLIYRYPMMTTDQYALSTLSAGLRESLVSQIRGQLGKMDELTAVNTLLNFMHYGFDYQTDQNQHNFEKPYFIEENLFYPYNDCEDRAMFYSYMLYNALGLDSQMVEFPGHEASTVRLTGRGSGVAYDVDEGRFYISDPTYLGSHTGQLMSGYEEELPSIDYTFIRASGTED